MTYTSVIVGTDGSQTATRAVRRAATLAHGMDARLMVVTAYTRTPVEEVGPPSARAGVPGQISAFGYQAAQETAQDGATSAQRTYRELTIDVATPEGEPGEALLEFTEAQGSDALCVIGSQGLSASGLFALGNVPNKIVHHAVGDVLVVATSGETSTEVPHRVLVGSDGSATAERALDRAIGVAKALKASLTVMTVDTPERATPVLDAAARKMKDAGVPYATEQVEGDPATALVERGAEFDLVVVGNKGMTGARRFLLGNVPNKVSQRIDADLLIVKTT